MPPYIVDPKTGFRRELTETEWDTYPINAGEIALPATYVEENGDNTADDGIG